MTSLTRFINLSWNYFQRRFPWQVFLTLIVIGLVSIWMYYGPEGILGKADAVGYAVCHRIESRSFLIGEVQFSVCARCTGQYLGAVLGILFLSIFRPYRSGRPSWKIIGFLLLWGMFYVVDGFNSFLHLIPGTEQFWLYEPNNTYRLLTGMGVGVGISVLLFPAFNQTIWKRYDPRPILEGVRDFGALLLLIAILSMIVLNGSPMVLYPLSLISASGVLILLTMVYSMVWVMLFRAEGHFERIRQLFFPLVAGFAVTLLQLIIISVIRYSLTGTWGEFPLG
jgi:uncharacterized membrane protein